MTDKKVDESWKEQVWKEKELAKAQEPNTVQAQSQTDAPVDAPESAPTPAQEPEATPEPAQESSATLASLLSSLSMQALMSLGEIPHPATQQPQVDLEQASYVIDMLGMLQQKTQGNLTTEEDQALGGLLYELRMKYVEKTESENEVPAS